LTLPLAKTKPAPQREDHHGGLEASL
jgi:hypothetical protein